MDDAAARLGALLRSGAAWKAIALQQSMSIATSVLSAAMASSRKKLQAEVWLEKSQPTKAHFLIFKTLLALRARSPEIASSVAPCRARVRTNVPANDAAHLGGGPHTAAVAATTRHAAVHDALGRLAGEPSALSGAKHGWASQ